MKNYIFFLLGIAFIAFVDCDGQDRANKTNTEVLKESKLLDSFSEKVEYIPKQYTEVITDTLFSSGHKIRVKFYSDMDTSILFEEKKNSINNKIYYRNFVTDVEVYKGLKNIFKHKINKAFLFERTASGKTEIDEYILQDFSLVDFDDHHKAVPILILSYINPKSKINRSFKIIFLEDAYKIEEII